MRRERRGRGIVREYEGTYYVHPDFRSEYFNDNKKGVIWRRRVNFVWCVFNCLRAAARFDCQPIKRNDKVRLDDKKAEERRVTPVWAAEASCALPSNHLEPVSSVQGDDQAVSERVDAVPVGSRAVDAEDVVAVALDRQSEGAVRPSSATDVHVVVSGHGDGHFVRRRAPRDSADGQLCAIKTEWIHLPGTDCPVTGPVHRPGRRPAAGEAVLEHSEGQERHISCC